MKTQRREAEADFLALGLCRWGVLGFFKSPFKYFITPFFWAQPLRAALSLGLGTTVSLDFFFAAATQDNHTRKSGTPVSHSPPVPGADLVPAATVNGSSTTGKDLVSGGTEQTAHQHLDTNSSPGFFLGFFFPLVSHWSLFGEEGVLLSWRFSCCGLFFSFVLSLCHTVRRRRLLCHIVFVPWTIQSATEATILGDELPHILFPFFPGSPWGLAYLYIGIISGYYCFLGCRCFVLVCFLFCFIKLVFFHRSSCICLSLLVKGVWLKLKRE